MGQLEPQLRAMLRGRIKHYLRTQRMTTILVTHDQTEANALADRIAVMEGGVLQQYATPAELKDRPANLFTGTFIGEPPMNVFAARIGGDGEMVRFTLDEGRAVIAFPQSEIARPVRERILGLRTVTIGIRPHALRIGEGPIKARVSSCQWLGDQTHVAAELGAMTASPSRMSTFAWPQGRRSRCRSVQATCISSTARAGGPSRMEDSSHDARHPDRHRCGHFGHQVRRLHAGRRTDCGRGDPEQL